MLALFTLTSCSGQGTGQQAAAPGNAPSAPAAAPAAGSSAQGPTIVLKLMGDSDTPVAEINGKAITEKELSAKIGSRLARLETQIFEMQRQGINQIIQEQLIEQEAKKQNVSVNDLLKKEVNDKVGDISDKEIDDFYQQNKARMGDKPLDQVKENLKRQLFARKSAVYRQNFIDRLREGAQVKIFLTRPTVDVTVDDDPMKGNKDAKITIIEFTDYQCPFCSRARPTIKQVLDTYGDKVRYVLRDFALDFHPHAKKAAEAAHCAGDQNKYWEYSDILWANQKALDTADLKKYASQLSLDQAKFDTCLDSGKYTAEVEKDIADGSKAGVTGTPSFFINGQMLTGARPFEQFKEVIDLELTTQK